MQSCSPLNKRLLLTESWGWSISCKVARYFLFLGRTRMATNGFNSKLWPSGFQNENSPVCDTPVQQRIIRGRGEENNTRTVIYKMATW